MSSDIPRLCFVPLWCDVCVNVVVGPDVSGVSISTGSRIGSTHG